jgi:hypothetical protein
MSKSTIEERKRAVQSAVDTIALQEQKRLEAERETDGEIETAVQHADKEAKHEKLREIARGEQELSNLEVTHGVVELFDVETPQGVKQMCRRSAASWKSFRPGDANLNDALHLDCHCGTEGCRPFKGRDQVGSAL